MEPQPIDPYQAPKSTQVAGLAPTQQDYYFREMKIFAWLAAGCIAVTIPFTIFIFLLMENIVSLPMEQLELVDGLHGLAFLLGVVFYCLWKYRCACNARYFYGGPLLYTPGWCVGSYFIPIMCLFRPYQCMKDIFDKTYALLGQTFSGGLMLIWWLSWIIAGIIERFTMLSEIRTMMFITHSLTLLSAMLVLWIIFTLTRRQYEIINDP